MQARYLEGKLPAVSLLPLPPQRKTSPTSPAPKPLHLPPTVAVCVDGIHRPCPVADDLPTSALRTPPLILFLPLILLIYFARKFGVDEKLSFPLMN